MRVLHSVLYLIVFGYKQLHQHMKIKCLEKNYSVHSVILNEYLTLVQILQVILHSPLIF